MAVAAAAAGFAMSADASCDDEWQLHGNMEGGRGLSSQHAM